MSDPEIAGYEIGYYGSLMVRFKDGHEAVWVPSSGGWGTPTTIEQFQLRYSGETVVVYNSPYQLPRNTRPDGFPQVDPAYNLERILSYWQTASEEIRSTWKTVVQGGGKLSNDLREAYAIVTNALAGQRLSNNTVERVIFRPLHTTNLSTESKTKGVAFLIAHCTTLYLRLLFACHLHSIMRSSYEPYHCTV